MELVNRFNDAGVHVQLQHEEEETSWEAHGWVCVRSEDGKELARDEDCQHNKNYSTRKASLEKLFTASMPLIGSSDCAGQAASG
jgi:hypothetical protein